MKALGLRFVGILSRINAIKACAVDNIDRSYKNKNISVLADRL